MIIITTCNNTDNRGCIQNLLSLPLISLIRIPHMNSKMVNNFLIKVHLQSIPKWLERISFLNEKDCVVWIPLQLH